MNHAVRARLLALLAFLATLALLGATWLAGALPVAAQSATASPTATPAAATPTPVPPASVALGTATSGTLGTYLTGPDGHALYWLSTDTATGTTCTGHCLTIWPPQYVAAGGTVTAPSAATGTLSTFARADTGGTQVRYNDHPLYYFAGDSAAGDTNGQGIKAFNGTWSVAVVAAAATAAPTATPAAVTSSAPTSTVLPPTSTGTGTGQSGTVGGGTLLLVLLGLAAITVVVVLASPLPRKLRGH